MKKGCKKCGFDLNRPLGIALEDSKEGQTIKMEVDENGLRFIFGH